MGKKFEKDSEIKFWGKFWQKILRKILTKKFGKKYLEKKFEKKFWEKILRRMFVIRCDVSGNEYFLKYSWTISWDFMNIVP